MNECCFEQDKITMLNAIYDLLENMGFPILSINSEAGYIIFGTKTGEPLRMTVLTRYPDKRTQISIRKLTETDFIHGEDMELAEVLFDELTAMLKKAEFA